MTSITLLLIISSILGLVKGGKNEIEVEEINCKKVRIELAFVIDASSSINEEDFKSEKTFVANLSNSFDIGQDKSRIGLVTFASTPKIEFGFTKYNNNAEIHKAVLDIKQIHGVTALGAAIKRVGEGVMKESRIGIPKYIIVLTDGQNNKWPKPSMVTPSLKQDGIIFISLGVGSSVDPEELKGISSSNSYLNISAFNKINLFVDEIKNEICKVKVKQQVKTCETEGDLTIILDTDNAKYLDGEVKLLSMILKRLEISPIKQRVSVVVDGQGVVIPLDKFNNRDDYLTYLSSAKFVSDNKSQSGLIVAGKLLSESRKNVPKTIVLIRAHEVSNATEEIKIASELRTQGLNIITLGIGSEINEKTLKELSSTRKTIISSNATFDQSYARQISETICQNLKKVFKECEKKQIELIFILDSSLSVGCENWVKQLQFTVRILNMMDVSNSTTRIGLVYFNSEASLGFKIGKFDNKQDNAEAILSLSYSEGSSALGNALVLARQQILAVKRKESVQVIILITDGKSNIGVKPYSVASKLEKEGVHVISVGISDKISKKQLRELSSTNEIFIIKDFNSLESFPVESITKEACQAINNKRVDCPVPFTSLKIEL